MTPSPPAFDFYAKDYLHDMTPVSPATCGIWSRFLFTMHDLNPRGLWIGTEEEACRVGGCSVKEFDAFKAENERHKFCDLEERNGLVIIINRRMYRETKAREQGRKRVAEYRSRQRKETVTPTVTAAWEQVRAAMKAGSRSELHPLVRKVVDAFGWRDLREGKADVVRGQFIKMYETEKRKEEADV